MIFNANEVNKVLKKFAYSDKLTYDELQTIRTLIVYLDNQEPKLTFEEFKELFTCKVNYHDDETLEVEVCPKNKIYMHVDKCVWGNRASNNYISISPDVEEHLYQVAHMEFMRKVRELKNEI